MHRFHVGLHITLCFFVNVGNLNLFSVLLCPQQTSIKNAPLQRKQTRDEQMVEYDLIRRLWKIKPYALAHLSVLPVGAKNSQRNLELLEEPNRPTQHQMKPARKKSTTGKERDRQRWKKTNQKKESQRKI